MTIAGRRRVDDLLQQLMLLLGRQPLLAQPVDHPVVDVDEHVHLRLPDGDEARREVALRDQLRAGADQIERHEQRPHQPRS